MSRKTRKLIWSAPLLAVFAAAAALALFAAPGAGSVFADALPAAPTNLKVMPADGDAGRTTLVLNWGASAHAGGYRIDISDRGGVWETLTLNTGSTETTYTDDSLSADDTRWYRVFALNSHGFGPVSKPASGTTDKKVNPGSVKNLRAEPNSKKPRERLDLSWDAPDENGGEMIVGYEIQVHVEGEWSSVVNHTPGQVTVVTKTSYMDKMDLDPGDRQLYRVRAVNGTSALSPGADVSASADADASKKWVQVTGTTKAAAAPGPVTGLTAVNLGPQNIGLYWYDPEDTGGWEISGYVIQAHRSGKKFPPAPSIAKIKGAAFIGDPPMLGSVDYMDNATWYQSKVPGNEVQAEFNNISPVDPDGAGSRPVGQANWHFRVYAVTTDHGPDDDMGEDADNVYRRSAKSSNTANVMAADRDTLDHDNNPDTDSLDPLAAPDVMATRPANNPPDAKKSQIDLSIKMDSALANATPKVEQIAYRIDYSENDGASWMLLEDDTRFTGFGPNRDYEDNHGLGFDEERAYRVFAIGKGSYTDVGPASDMVYGETAPSTVPDKPTDVKASSPSLRSIKASWTAPKDNGGQSIAKYLVQWVMDDGDGVAEAEDFTANVPTNGKTDAAMTEVTFLLISKLEDNALYVFRVAGVNMLGNAERPANADDMTHKPKWSEPVLFNTADATKPGAVEGLTSEAATDTSGKVTGVNLLWNRPSDKIMIESYDIEVVDDDGDWVNPTDGENTRDSLTSYTDPDEPEDDETRRYRVRASNGAGDGPWSMVSYPRKPADDHTHIASLTAPTNLKAMADAEGLNVSWTPGENATVHYVWAFPVGGTKGEWSAPASGEDTMVTMTGLTSGKSYWFIAVAGRDDGGQIKWSKWSEWIGPVHIP
jgi:hypothetical protein